MNDRVNSSSSSSNSNLVRRRYASELVISLLVLVCILGAVELYFQFKLEPGFDLVSQHDAHIVFEPVKSNHPKIAFLFLVRQNLPLDFLWHSFFKNADVANFSIYIHSKPGFVFNQSATMSSFFYDRQLKNSVEVGWGKPSMIEAERLLLRAALDDPSNQRFVLLSDSCVPLHNFRYIYNYLISSPRSFVDSFLNVKEERYNPEMSPVIQEDKWRKGSQWITLVRDHAKVVAEDETVFPIFSKFCKRRPLPDLSKGNESLKLQEQHNCIPDEHYVATLLTMSNLQDELERRTLTYSSWNHSVDRMNTVGWHPITFGYANASPEQIEEIKEIDHVYFESENRTEWCSTNLRKAPCFLFARKFSRGAAMRLLTSGLVGPYDPTTLFDKET